MPKLLAGALSCALALAAVASLVARPVGDLGIAATTLSAIVMAAFGIAVGYQVIESRHRPRH